MEMKNQSYPNMSSRVLRARRPIEAPRIDLLSILSRRCQGLKISAPESNGNGCDGGGGDEDDEKNVRFSTNPINQTVFGRDIKPINHGASNLPEVHSRINDGRSIPSIQIDQSTIRSGTINDGIKTKSDFKDINKSNLQRFPIPIIIIQDCADDEDSLSWDSLDSPSSP